jgi:hypothetical protein
MLSKMTLLSAFLWLVPGLTTLPLLAQSGTAPSWTLPHDTAVRHAGPRTYRFIVVYYTASPTGQVVHRQRVSGDYTRGLPQDLVEWNHVTLADAGDDKAPFAAPQESAFMDGFRYPSNADSMAPDFFKSFPATAVMQRNLVWDTGMFELFGQKYLDKLQLNQPLHIGGDQGFNMPQVGTFRNRDIVLEWVGRSQRNGQECALINYRAFFNPLQVASGGMTLDGRSDYWGEIWVSLATRQIEHATLYEEVNGQMKLPGQNAPQPLSVFRIGSLEPIEHEQLRQP